MVAAAAFFADDAEVADLADILTDMASCSTWGTPRPVDQVAGLLRAAAAIAHRSGFSIDEYREAAHLAWPAASSTHHPAPAEVKPSIAAAAPATLAGVDDGAVQGEQGCPFDEVA